MEVAQPPNYNVGPPNGERGRRSRSRSNSRDRRRNRHGDHNDVPARSKSSSSDSSGRSRPHSRHRRNEREGHHRKRNRNDRSRRNRNSSDPRNDRDGRRGRSQRNQREADRQMIADYANAMVLQDYMEAAHHGQGNQAPGNQQAANGGQGQDRQLHQENERQGRSPPQNGHQAQIQNQNPVEELRDGRIEHLLHRIEERLRGMEQDIADMRMGRQIMPQNHYHYHQEQIYHQHHYYRYHPQHHDEIVNPHQQAIGYGNPALQDHAHQGNGQQNQQHQHYHQHHHPQYPHQNRQQRVEWHGDPGGHLPHQDHVHQGNEQQHQHHQHYHQDHHPHHPPQNRQPQIEWHENHGGHQAQEAPHRHQDHHRQNRGTAQAILLRQRVRERHSHGQPLAQFIFRERVPLNAESFLLWFNYHITNHLNEEIVGEVELYQAILRVYDHYPVPDFETFWRDLNEFRLRMIGPERPQTPLESPQYSPPSSPVNGDPTEEEQPPEDPREPASPQWGYRRVVEDQEEAEEERQRQAHRYSPMSSPEYGPPVERGEEPEQNFDNEQVRFRLRFWMQRYDAQLGEEEMPDEVYRERWLNHRNEIPPNNQ